MQAGAGQDLTQAYLQQKAALAEERQQLLKAQSELSRQRIDHNLPTGPLDAAAKAAHRQQLIDKLQQGQAGQLAALEALKKAAAKQDTVSLEDLAPPVRVTEPAPEALKPAASAAQPGRRASKDAQPTQPASPSPGQRDQPSLAASRNGRGQDSMHSAYSRPQRQSSTDYADLHDSSMRRHPKARPSGDDFDGRNDAMQTRRMSRRAASGRFDEPWADRRRSHDHGSPSFRQSKDEGTGTWQDERGQYPAASHSRRASRDSSTRDMYGEEAQPYQDRTNRWGQDPSSMPSQGPDDQAFAGTRRDQQFGRGGRGYDRGPRTPQQAQGPYDSFDGRHGGYAQTGGRNGASHGQAGHYGTMHSTQQYNPFLSLGQTGTQHLLPINSVPSLHHPPGHQFAFPGSGGPPPPGQLGTQQMLDESPPYVRELQSQLQALIAALENKMALAAPSQSQPSAPFAPLQSFPGSQPFGATTQALALPATPKQALPEALQSDAEMRELWAVHAKEMAKLHLELDRTRTLAELQELRARMTQLANAPLVPALPEPEEAGQAEEKPEEEVIVVKKPVKKPLKKKPPKRRVEPESESEEEFEVPEQRFSEDEDDFDDYRRGRHRGRSRNRYRDDYRDEEPEPPPPKPVEAYRIFTLYLTLERMMPVLQAGTYSIAVVLYDGYEPVMATIDTPVKVVTALKEMGVGEEEGRVVWSEHLVMPDLRLRSSSLLVLEVNRLQQAADAAEPKAEVIAWAFAQILQKGEVVGGLQSVPVYRLPLMLKAQRKFTFDHAFIDFSLSDTEPKEPEPVPEVPVAQPKTDDDDEDALPARPKGPEDVKGVPTAAWCRVNRGVPPADPFKPGEGFVLMVDGARYLPGNATISKIVGSVWSCDRQLLCAPFEALCTLESDAYVPSYNAQIILGAGMDRFDDPTATLLLQIDTVERESRELRCVGYAAVPLFIDPRENGQPTRKNINDYVLNQGGFQIPLHIAPPDREYPTFKGSSLEIGPRVPCASILLRLLDVPSARAQRHRKPPKYSDRAYDTSRAYPTEVEVDIFYLVMLREALPVRTALMRLINPELEPANTPAAAQKKGPTGAPGTGKAGGLFGFGFGKNKAAVVVNEDGLSDEEGSDTDDEAAAPEPPAAPVEEGPQMSDVELVEVMKAKLARPELWNDVPIDYGRSLPYNKELGFQVAVDAAMRLPRALPAAAITSITPPGAFYQEIPVIDDVAVTLQYDMDAPLNAPTWLDGYQPFKMIPYDTALCVIIDVRTVIPGSGTTAPVGWAALPVFVPGTRFVATGHYQLPLFQGLPSKALLDEMAAAGDMEAAVAENLKTGRLKYLASACSVLVRLMDDQRRGQLEDRADSGAAQPLLRFPGYLRAAPRQLAEVVKEARSGRTYDNARSKDIPLHMWIQELNDAIIAATGLDQAEEEGEADSTQQDR